MAAVQFIVEGGATLSGSIRPSGNKNAALPIIAASLLSEHPVTLENVPRIRDTETLVELVRSVGASAEWTERNTLHIHAKSIRPSDLDPELCRKIRASILLAGPLLARCGEVTLPPPGGDVIGRRRLDTHFLALERLGADVEWPTMRSSFAPRRSIGADVFLDEPSVTATENALVAATAARGTTILRNAASEPHVQDLAHFLCTLGAQIEGIGTNTVTIHGGQHDRRRNAPHRPGPHRGRLVHRARGRHAVGDSHRGRRRRAPALDAAWASRGSASRAASRATTSIVPAEQSREIQSDLGGHVPKLEDQPWPAFPADVMSIAIVTATQCNGLILIHEKMFESRMFFVDKLIGMGARIVLCDPHRAFVAGPSPLRAATVESPDIRAGMAMLLAALCAKGQSTINNAGQIERGYERIDERLNALGARITRVDDRRR